MNADYTIRRATLADQNRLTELWTAFMEEQAGYDNRLTVADDAAERWNNDLPVWIDDATIQLWVVTSPGDNLAGFARAHRTGPPPVYEDCAEVYIDEVFVAEAHRRKGIATALVDTTMAWAASVDAERIRLSTVAASGGAEAFWNAYGASPLATIWTMPVPEEEASGADSPDLNEGSAKIGFDWN